MIWSSATLPAQYVEANPRTRNTLGKIPNPKVPTIATGPAKHQTLANGLNSTLDLVRRVFSNSKARFGTGLLASRCVVSNHGRIPKLSSTKRLRQLGGRR